MLLFVDFLFFNIYSFTVQLQLASCFAWDGFSVIPPSNSTYILYCPEQAPMGARSSSAKIWGWGVTRRTHLNGSTIPTQGPTLNTKLAAMGLNGLPSSVRPWFVEASLTVDKADSCYKGDLLVASLLNFRSIQLSLAVHKFHAAGKERCK